VGRPDDVPCLLTQPGNVVTAQAAGLQGASHDDTHLAAADGAPSRGQIRPVPWMATGMIGTWQVSAMMKAPSFKSPIVPSGEAVPSG